MSTSGGSACGSRQTPGSSTSTDNSSASGSMAHHSKADFGKKHRKIVRILTVIAYVISVSTAALLLSAYYVFIWDPSPTPAKNSSDTTTTMALSSRARGTTSPGSPYYLHGGSNSYSHDSFALSPSQPKLSKHPKPSRKGNHYNTKPAQHQIPTPQSLIMETLSSTTPQQQLPPFKNTPPPPPPRNTHTHDKKLYSQHF